MKKQMMALVVCAVGVTLAQTSTDARAAYQQRQLLGEVPRLVQQFDQLAANQDQLTARLLKVESGASAESLRAEIDALRAEIAELRASLRREQDAMRREIVTDLSKRISALPPPAPAKSAAPARTPAAQPAAELGPHYEYVVEPGQTLSLIAKGFDTTVAKIVAANPGLKPDRLRVGQKLIIPAEDAAGRAKKSR